MRVHVQVDDVSRLCGARTHYRKLSGSWTVDPVEMLKIEREICASLPQLESMGEINRLHDRKEASLCGRSERKQG